MNGEKINWTAIGGIAAVVAAIGTVLTVVVGLMVWWQTEAKSSEEKAHEPPNLTAPDREKPVGPDDVRPAAERIPWGPSLSTPIPFRNDGKREALIKQVILSNGKWVPTPHRDNIIGAGKTIHVTFEPRHYVKRAGQYMLVLREPAPAPGGGQWTTLDVAFVDPRAVGQTFVGTVTIIFDGLEQMHFKNVQIDALKEAPKKIE